MSDDPGPDPRPGTTTGHATPTGAATVSVVIPTHDRVTLLRRTLASVLAQDHRGLEVIVVCDDGDPGRQRQVDALAATDRRVRVIHHDRPKGVATARNAGLAAATGTWVAFVDDDDMWAPQKVRLQLEALAERPGTAWSFVAALDVDLDEHTVRIRRCPVPDEDLRRTLGHYNCIPGGGSGVLASRMALAELGGFDTSFSMLADWGLWARLAGRWSAAYVDEPLVAYVIHAASMTNRTSTTLEEHRRLMAELGTDCSCPTCAADAAVFHRWLVAGHLRAGRRWAAARHDLALAVRHRRPVALVDAARSLVLGDAVLRPLLRRPSDPQPAWLTTLLGPSSGPGAR